MKAVGLIARLREARRAALIPPASADGTLFHVLTYTDRRIHKAAPRTAMNQTLVETLQTNWASARKVLFIDYDRVLHTAAMLTARQAASPAAISAFSCSSLRTRRCLTVFV